MLIYCQDLSFEPTNWDDEQLVFNNPFTQTITVENIISILTPGKTSEDKLYLPVTYLSNLVEFQLPGNRSRTVHFDNLALHLVNICLVFMLVSVVARERLAGFIAALLFTVHPLQAEAVAWGMGRKDLLMTMFSLLSMISFTEFINAGSRKAYMLSLVFFLVAVFSKPSAFILPLVLLALCWRFEKKIDRELLFRLLPFFLISMAVCALNSLLEVNTFGHEVRYVFFRMLFIPAIACEWILRILLLDNPQPYYSWYDYYDGNCISAYAYVPFAAILAVTAYAFIKKLRMLFTCMGLTLVGFIPAFILATFSFRDFVTADRYGYFPLIGIFMLAGAVVSMSGSKVVKFTLVSVFLLFAMLSAFKAHRQAGVWRNSETVWNAVLKERPDSFIARYNLGNYYFKSRYDLKSAEFNYRKANSITPDSDSWYNIGIICELTGRKEESDICYGRAVVLNPDSDYAVKKLALAYYRKKDLDNSLKMFSRLAELSPTSADAYLYCGRIFEIKGDRGMAAKAYGLYENLKKQGY